MLSVVESVSLIQLPQTIPFMQLTINSDQLSTNPIQQHETNHWAQIVFLTMRVISGNSALGAVLSWRHVVKILVAVAPPQSGRPLPPAYKSVHRVHLQSVSSALNVPSFNGPLYKCGAQWLCVQMWLLRWFHNLAETSNHLKCKPHFFKNPYF